MNISTFWILPRVWEDDITRSKQVVASLQQIHASDAWQVTNELPCIFWVLNAVDTALK